MLSRISSLRRHAFFSKLIAGKLTFVRDASLPCRVSEHGISTAGSVSLAEITPTRTSADYSIFKGKAALTLRPVLPKFSTVASGHQIVDKRGVVLLKFLPAIGLRKYDDKKKQFFALSATEVGCLISLGPSESCEFFHDPSMKSSTEGQIKKTLSISPLSDGSGYIFSLSVTNSIHKTIERFTLPVNKGEFSVMRSACSFALPHILGWDRIVRPRDQARHGLFIPSKKQSVPGSEYSK